MNKEVLKHISDMKDISQDFKYSKFDAQEIPEILRLESDSRAIRAFSNRHRGLSDYAYWFLLGSLWVSYTGFSDLDLWKRLFSSSRPNRRTSLMKPSELRALDAMDESFLVYRAHRPGEADWIAYTFDLGKACLFAEQRKSEVICGYRVKKDDVLAYFTRRGEFEILVLDKEKAVKVQEIGCIIKP